VPGRHLLSIRHIAYGAHADSVTITNGSEQAIALRISQRAIVLEPVELDAISPTRPGATRSSVITRAQIEHMIGRARNLGDLVRAHVPGASVSERRGGILCVEFRAARGNRVSGCNFPMVVVDNIPIPSPGYFFRDTPIADLERVEFIPSSEGAGRYGTGSQYGVLVITTRRAALTGMPARAPQRRRFPAYDWSQEPGGYRWSRSLAGSVGGNIAGLAAGLLILGCGPGDAACVERESTGTALAALALPAIGSAVGARVFGATEMSTGRSPYAAIGAALPLVVGYAIYVDGERSGLESSRLVGSALMVVGAPAIAVVADLLFRRTRD
jgi:hypothetical protein